MKNKLYLLLTTAMLLLISACSSVSVSHVTEGKVTQIKRPDLAFAKNNEFVVLVTKKGDTLSSLAEKYLGDEKKGWIIADFNGIYQLPANREIVIPLNSHNKAGVTTKGLQTIPILCYHRFGAGHAKLAVSEKKFIQQMQFLKDNHFNVIEMRDLIGFLKNNAPLPKKSVVITIDDGYRSTYDTAFEVLKSFGFPATVFLYTDFTGARDAMTWKQGLKMIDSQLIDIQPHSKSHPNMSIKNIDETAANYKIRMRKEIETPGRQIKQHLHNELHTFAYPFGDTNKLIIDLLKQNKYALGVSVEPGSNTAFAPPYMLKRTMIFGDLDIKDFGKALIVFKEKNLN